MGFMQFALELVDSPNREAPISSDKGFGTASPLKSNDSSEILGFKRGYKMVVK